MTFAASTASRELSDPLRSDAEKTRNLTCSRESVLAMALSSRSADTSRDRMPPPAGPDASGRTVARPALARGDEFLLLSWHCWLGVGRRTQFVDPDQGYPGYDQRTAC